MNDKTNSCNKKILNIDNYASNKPNINKIVIRSSVFESL